MPLQLLEITVRPDWRDLTQQIAVQRLRTWRAVQIAVAGATLTVLLSRLIAPAWPWHELLRLALFGAIFWIVPLWALLRTRQRARAALDRSWPLFVLLLAAIAVAYISRPQWRAEGTSSALAFWLPLLALAVPCLTWPIVRWMRRAFPEETGRWGLSSSRWASNLTIGALAGAALGLHMAVTLPFLPGQLPPGDPSGPQLVWVVCYQAGLMGLGQELLLRGLAYDALLGGGAGSFPRAAGKIALLNLLVYLSALFLMPAVSLGGAAWLLIYGAALAVLSTFLRQRQQSLLPGLAAAVVFNLFAAPLFGL